MADEKQRQENLNEMRRELKRRAFDQLKVYNPLKEGFNTIYDGFTHVVDSQKEATFPRYIAEKWMREYIDYMINEEERVVLEKENDKRRGKGWEILNPQEQDQFILKRKITTNNEEKRLEHMRVIYRGMSKEHGMDIPAMEPKKADRRPMDEKILEQLDAEMGTVLPEDLGDTEAKKDELIKEISEN